MCILKNNNLLILLPALLIMVGCDKYSDDETYTFDNCITDDSSLLTKYPSLKDKHSVTVNVQEKLLKIDDEVLPVNWIEQKNGYRNNWGSWKSVDGYVLEYTNPKRIKWTYPEEDDILYLDQISLVINNKTEKAELMYEFSARGYQTYTKQSESNLIGLKGKSYEYTEAVRKSVRVGYVCSESE